MRFLYAQIPFFFYVIFSPVFCLASIVVDGNRIMDQSMEENLCALTFDDGPSAYTPELLKHLEENGIKATFFVLGSQAAHYPHILEMIKAAGHEIGNHSWSHANLRLLGEEKQRAEIKSTDDLLRSHGIVPLYLRPPYGSFDERTIHIAEKMGLSLLLWSLDSLDWKHVPSNYAKLLSTRGTIYEDGSLRGIFLFHDIHKATVDDLPRIIANLKEGGCKKFVTVNEYLQGLVDPEPALVMNRHPVNPERGDSPMIPADSSPLPFARCSVPKKQNTHQSPLELESAHVRTAEEDDLVSAAFRKVPSGEFQRHP